MSNMCLMSYTMFKQVLQAKNSRSLSFQLLQVHLIQYAASKVLLSPLRLLRKAAMPAMPPWSRSTSTRLALHFLLAKPSTPAVFSVIQSSRIWWSSNMPPWGTACTGVGVQDEEDGDEAGDAVAILKNLKTKWLRWQLTLYSVSV